MWLDRPAFCSNSPLADIKTVLLKMFNHVAKKDEISLQGIFYLYIKLLIIFETSDGNRLVQQQFF